MSKAREAKITPVEKAKQEFTSITFKPDLQKFGLTHLTSDIVALMTRRAYDIAASARGVKVYLNGDRVPVSFRIMLYKYICISTVYPSTFLFITVDCVINLSL